MESEISLLLWGAAAGLMSAVTLELARSRLERGRSAYQEKRELKKARRERVSEFLRGEEPAGRPAAPAPAWLRQVAGAKRYPLARLGLRNDEDYGTDARPAAGAASPGRSITLLKTFHRGSTRARRPARGRGGKFLLGQAHILGRGSQCDIQVLDPAVSLLHAFIRFEDNHYRLYDLGSTGGTLVNGEPVNLRGAFLQGGDRIQMGGTTFEFGWAAPESEAEPADPFLVL